MRRIVLLMALTLMAGAASAQKYPERRLIRSGNSSYEKGDYAKSEVQYLKALSKTPDSYEARFNYANSLYKQGRLDEANQIYDELASAENVPASNVANSNYNIGNTLFQQGKLKEALEAYKNALRANPDDREAKFNYAYTKKLLEEQQDQDNQNNQNQNDQNDQNDQNQDNKDGQGDQNGQDDKGDQDQQDDKGDQKDGQGDKDKDKDGDKNNDDKGDGQTPRQQPSGVSREQAEQMLDAVQMSEDKTREKVEEKSAAAVGARSVKNW